MKRELRDKWIEALRSGEYRQVTGVLHSDGAYCCLGVLCKVAKKRTPSDALNLDRYPALRELRDQCGLGKEEGDELQARLTDLNDNKQWSFKRIAAWIKKHVPVED